MTNRTRGWLLAIVSMAAFAGVTELAFSPVRTHALPPVPPAPSPPSPRIDAAESKAAVCNELANQYALLWSSAARCTADHECTAEYRADSWSGLDGCFRVWGSPAMRAAPDGIAARWREAGCADLAPPATDVCPVVLPAAQCRDGACIEKPPQPLPRDWRPHAVRGAARLYLPPDLDEVDEDPSKLGTALLRRDFEGVGRSLTIVVTRVGTLANDSAKLVLEKAIEIGGHESMLFITADSGPSTATSDGLAPRRFHAMAELPDVVTAGGDAAAPARLTFRMDCQTREECDALASIVTSAHVLVKVNAPQQVDGGPLRIPF